MTRYGDQARNPYVFVSLLTLIISINVFHFAFAQQIERVEIPSSLNPVGSGARALGMGGAFIAVADDATSASWNPGGLIQLETPETSVVGFFFHRSETQRNLSMWEVLQVVKQRNQVKGWEEGIFRNQLMEWQERMVLWKYLEHWVLSSEEWWLKSSL